VKSITSGEAMYKVLVMGSAFSAGTNKISTINMVLIPDLHFMRIRQKFKLLF